MCRRSLWLLGQHVSPPSAWLPAAASVSSRNLTTAPPAERLGRIDTDLKPQDYLGPLLPTWNPPPTRSPRPEELEVGTRLRFKVNGRWWPAAVQEKNGDMIRVTYEGWPARFDEWAPSDSDRLFLHESFHPDYKLPPVPRPERLFDFVKDSRVRPETPRPRKPRAFDPEKDRLKRATRPAQSYDPIREREKRLLRVQPNANSPFKSTAYSGSGRSDHGRQSQTTPATITAFVTKNPPWNNPDTPKTPTTTLPSSQNEGASLAWTEVDAPSKSASRAFRHVTTGEVTLGTPTSGWVKLRSNDGATYYWNACNGDTQWEHPTE